jgi:hypothetical protein
MFMLFHPLSGGRIYVFIWSPAKPFFSETLVILTQTLSQNAPTRFHWTGNLGQPEYSGASGSRHKLTELLKLSVLYDLAVNRPADPCCFGDIEACCATLSLVTDGNSGHVNKFLAYTFTGLWPFSSVEARGRSGAP